jgi:hypothetical protein
VVGSTRPKKGDSESDCYILNLGTNIWQAVQTAGPAVCRHAATVADGSMFIFGGYDGALQGPTDQLWKLPLGFMLPQDDADAGSSHTLLFGGENAEETQQTGMKAAVESNSESKSCAAISSGCAASTSNSRVAQELWQSTRPLTLQDLPEAETQGSERMLVGTLHRHAVKRGLDTYLDPKTGYSVFTSLYLKRRDCCGNKCRHCPHGHKNVPKAKDSRLDW